jgi:hypothetical protein
MKKRNFWREVKYPSFIKDFLKTIQRLLALWILFGLSNNCFAQNQDAIWYFGDSTGIDFNSGNAVTLTNSQSWSSEANTSICDNQGNLLFYAGFDWSNNFYVWNKQNNVMVGSNTITGIGNSSTITQGLLICPMPGDTNKYYLFTMYPNGANIELNYQVIDMSLDTGRGAVISSNINLITNSHLSEKMIAIRHANGRDWWLLYSDSPFSSGQFFKHLITPSGIGSLSSQNIGPLYNLFGQISLSPHGDKILCADLTRGLNLYDFDRCTGLLSNWVELGFPPYSFTTSNGFYGCSFSPSGRYIYATRLDSAFQYDILAPDIKASRIFLGKSGNVNQYWLGQHKLGPDGKIYFTNNDWDLAATLGLDKFLNVINNPDSNGLACNLSFYSFSLNDRKSLWGMPNIPDFKLGAISGSVCDSLTAISDIKGLDKIMVHPNPVDNEITFESMQTGKPTLLTLYNQNGIPVYAIPLNGERRTIVNVRNLSSGFYFYEITNSDFSIVRGKLCIIH